MLVLSASSSTLSTPCELHGGASAGGNAPVAGCGEGGGGGRGGGGGEAARQARAARAVNELPAPPSHGPLPPPGSRTTLPAREGAALMSPACPFGGRCARVGHMLRVCQSPVCRVHTPGCRQGGRGPPPSGASDGGSGDMRVETHQLLRAAHEDGRVHLQIHLPPPARLSARGGDVGSSHGRGGEDERRTLEHVFTASNPRSVMSLWSYSPSPMRNKTIPPVLLTVLMSALVSC